MIFSKAHKISIDNEKGFYSTFFEIDECSESCSEMKQNIHYLSQSPSHTWSMQVWKKKLHRDERHRNTTSLFTLFQKACTNGGGRACDAIDHTLQKVRTPRSAVLVHFFDVHRTLVFYRRFAVLPDFFTVLTLHCSHSSFGTMHNLCKAKLPQLKYIYSFKQLSQNIDRLSI